MSSGSVKDSARGMMAQLAERRDDLAGVLTTSSSATAFTVATNQFFASLADRRQGIDDRAAPTSGASPSLAVDGLAARPTGSRPARPVPAGGLLLSGTPYRSAITTRPPSSSCRARSAPCRSGHVTAAMLAADAAALAKIANASVTAAKLGVSGNYRRFCKDRGGHRNEAE